MATGKKLRIGRLGWAIAHGPFRDTGRFPSSLIVVRTEGYTYAEVWDLCIVQGPFSCRPVPNPNRPIRNCSIAVFRVLQLSVALGSALDHLCSQSQMARFVLGVKGLKSTRHWLEAERYGR